MKKYKLLKDQSVNFLGRTLHRIKYLKSFCEISKGDLGGWIEKESNLSQVGEAWVVDKARVSGEARVVGEAWVVDKAWVGGEAWVNKKVIAISTEQWTVTFCNKIQIGCQNHSVEEWSNFTDTEIQKMHSEALSWWKKWKSVILELAKIAIIKKEVA